MSLHKENSFEAEICEHFGANGWLYAAGDAANYDRARALFPADVLAWVQATQPNAWETLTRNHGAQAGDTLLARLRDQLDQRGTLDVLRHGCHRSDGEEVNLPASYTSNQQAGILGS